MEQKEYKQLFKQYHGKLVFESVLKAILCGLAVGLAASIIPAVIGLIFNFSALWISLAVMFAALAVAAPLFYFLLFKPTALAVTRRVDALGLKERVITMLEYEKEDSYMAQVQREDTKTKLETTDKKQLKFNSKIMIRIAIALIVVAAVSSVLMAFSVINVEDQLPWQSRNWAERVGFTPPPAGFATVEFSVMTAEGAMEEQEDGSFWPVQYTMHNGGLIEDFSNQVVEIGQDAQTVVVQADLNYRFRFWLDEYLDWRARMADWLAYIISNGLTQQEAEAIELPALYTIGFIRTVEDVQGNMQLFAIMEYAPGGGTPPPGDEAPGEPGSDSGEPGNPPPTGEPPTDGSGDPTDNGGEGGGPPGDWSNPDLIFGQEPDRGTIQAAIIEIQRLLAAGEPIPPSLRAIFERYFVGL